jgi:hypothetical protein
MPFALPLPVVGSGRAPSRWSCWKLPKNAELSAKIGLNRVSPAPRTGLHSTTCRVVQERHRRPQFRTVQQECESGE